MSQEISNIHVRQATAEDLVKRYSMIGGALSIIPMPYIDIAAVLATQVRMVLKLSRLYGIPFSQSSGKTIIASLIGSVVPAKFAFGATGWLIKSIPLIGPVAGALTMPAFAAASTYAVGKVFVQHFESGGTMLSFDPEAVRAHYESLVQEELGKAQPKGNAAKPGKATSAGTAAA